MKKMTVEGTLLVLSVGLALLALGVLVGPGLFRANTASAAKDAALQESYSADVEAGRVLFRNLGCVTCHVHSGIEGDTGVMGFIGAPDLSSYQGNPEYLRRWLADPQAVKPGTEMPNLRLTSEQIDLLAAFLSAP